jgi:hypothetical protein
MRKPPGNSTWKKAGEQGFKSPRARHSREMCSANDIGLYGLASLCNALFSVNLEGFRFVFLRYCIERLEIKLIHEPLDFPLRRFDMTFQQCLVFENPTGKRTYFLHFDEPLDLPCSLVDVESYWPSNASFGFDGMNDTFPRLGVVENAISIFVQSGKNVTSLNEWILNFDVVFFEKIFYYFHPLVCHRWGRFVAATPIGFAVATGVKKVVLSSVMSLLWHRHRRFSKVGVIVNKTFCELQVDVYDRFFEIGLLALPLYFFSYDFGQAAFFYSVLHC